MKKLLVIEIDGIIDIAKECEKLGWHPIFIQTESYSDWLPLENVKENFDIRTYKELSYFDIVKIIKEEQIQAVLPISLLEPEGIRDSLVKNFIKNFNLQVTMVANSPVTMETTFDKWMTKEVLSNTNIPVTVGKLIHPSQEQININDFFEFPVIVKERKSFTGKGIRIIHNQESFDKYLTKNRKKNLFIEPFIKGAEISMEVISWKGKKIFQPLVYKGETRVNILEHPAYRPRISPFKKGSALEEKIIAMVNKAVDVLFLEGASEFEFIIIDGEPFIMEINPRISGITKLCNAAGGVNVYKELTNISITDSISSNYDKKEKYALQLPLSVLPEGKFLKKLKKNPHVKYIKPISWMPILPIKSNVIISYDSIDKLYEGMIELEQYSHVRYIEEAKRAFENF